MVSRYRNTIANSVAFSLPIFGWWGIFVMVYRKRFYSGRFVPLSSVIVAALLLTAGCNSPSSSTAPAEVTDAAPDNGDAARVEAARQCIMTALNNTVSSGKTNEELAASFGGQDLNNCPQDFLDGFVATGNAARLAIVAHNELLAHVQKEEAAKQESALDTATEVWNGKPSGRTPYRDWQTKRGALDEALSACKRTFEEARSALMTLAAKYQVYEGKAPTADAPPQSPIENAM